MTTDSNFQSVKLLLPFDNQIVDFSQNIKSLTVAGDAALDTFKSVFGGKSLRNSTGYIKTTSGNSDFVLNGDFTVEGWYYFATAISGYPTIASIGLYNDGILIRDDFYINGTLVANGLFRANSIPDEWNHVAVCRISGIITLYINGVSHYSYTNAATINAAGNAVMLGASLHSNGSENWVGWLDEWRVTAGFCRYTANFTVPTEAFSTVGRSIPLLITDNIVSTNANLIAYAFKVSDGSPAGSLTITATDNNPFTVNFAPTIIDPVFVIIMAVQGNVWRPSTLYAVGALVFPSNPATTPYYYKRVNVGTSGTTEPTWTTTVNSTCDDNGITGAWQLVAGLTQPVIVSPLIPS